MAKEILRFAQDDSLRHHLAKFGTTEGSPGVDGMALVLRKELEDRLEANGHQLEWADVRRDLMNLQCAEVEQDGKHFLLRSEAQGTCGRAFAAAGIALPPTIQQIEPRSHAHSHCPQSSLLMPRPDSVRASRPVTTIFEVEVSKMSQLGDDGTVTETQLTPSNQRPGLAADANTHQH